MNKTKKAIINLLLRLGIFGIVIFILFQFILTIRICYINDEYPNIKDGDLVVFSKISEPKFDDVVLYTDDSGTEHFGRIVSIAGETIEVDDENGLMVNGGVVFNQLPYKTEPQSGVNYPVVLQQDEFFILSDLRDQSKDSRTYGPIKKSQIIGTEIFLMRRRSF